MITTNTGAKKLESSDNWREIFPDNQGAQGAHNTSVGAHDAAISQMCQTVSGTKNNCGHTINAGEYFIANGGKYKATASIPVNEAWSGSAQAVSDNDLINALNNKIANYRFVDGGKNPSNWNNAYATTENTIILYSIAQASIPTGGPTSAYPYGTLIAITSSTTSGWEFTHKLIYMVDNINDPAIYIKNESESYWYKFAGTSVTPVS